MPLCLQESVNSFSTPQVSHFNRAKPASTVPQSRYRATTSSTKPLQNPYRFSNRSSQRALTSSK
jgi:hypothetical protein